MSKNFRFNEGESIRENPTPTSPILTLSTTPESIMQDIDIAGRKKSVKREKYFRVVNILKEFVNTTTITKRILSI